MYCDRLSFWLYLNQTDPDGTLVWLTAQLLDAEASNEKVHIIGHIPPGITYCLKQWSFNFYRIVNRFESTIAGLFYGHTHDDSFSVFFEESGGSLGRPFHVMYVTPSMTTFENHLPAYRIYTVDGNYEGSSHHVLDHETHVLDLDETNSKDTPVFKLEYTAKSAYSMPSLFPTDWSNLITRIMNDEKLLLDYVERYFRQRRSCDASCRYNKLCEMRMAHSYDNDIACKDIPKVVDPAKLEKISTMRKGFQDLIHSLGDAKMTPNMQGNSIGDVISACLLHSDLAPPKKADQEDVAVMKESRATQKEFGFLLIFSIILWRAFC